MAGASVEIVGLDRLLRAARKENLVDGPMRKMLEDLGSQSAKVAAQASPRRTGRMAGSWSHRASANAVVILNNARARPKRPGARHGKTKYPYPYPRRQEFGTGPNRERVRRAIQSSGIQSAVSKAAKDIEVRFARG